MRLVGRPELIDEPWFATGADRARHADVLDEAVGGWIARRTRAEVIAAFEKAEAAVAPIQDVRDVMTDPQYAALDTITTVDDPELGPLRMQNVLFRLSATPGAIRWAGRPHGADTDTVLTELGLTEPRSPPCDRRAPCDRAGLPLTWLYVPGDRPEVVAKALVCRAPTWSSSTWRTRSPRTARSTPAPPPPSSSPSPRPVPVHVRVNALDSPLGRGRPPDPLRAARPVRPPAAQGDLARRRRTRRGARAPPAAARSPCTPSWKRPSASSGPSRSPPPTPPCAASRSARRTSGPTWAYGTTRAWTGRAPAWSSPPGRRVWPPPAQSVYPDIRDLDGLAASCAHGRALGFLGRAAIHPRQLPVIERAYLPTPEEIEAAEAIVKAAATDPGAQALPDGRFIDAAVVAAPTAPWRWHAATS